MLANAEARALVEQHLGRGGRARHSIFVGFMMRSIAGALDEDVELWEVTGFCHDLDFELTKHEWSQHGLLAATWLEGKLPAGALDAIRAHDHRTGVRCDSAICRALKLADALAIACDTLGPEAAATLAAPDAAGRLARGLAERPYLPPLILDNARALGLPLAQLAGMLTAAPPSS